MSSGKILLIINIEPINQTCFAVLIMEPLPSGKECCGLLKRLDWDIVGKWGMAVRSGFEKICGLGGLVWLCNIGLCMLLIMRKV